MSELRIKIRPELKAKFPSLRLGILQSFVEVSESTEALKGEMEGVIQDLSSRLNAESIRQMPVVKSFKDAYRALGKDPNRYRPSAEALLRRVSSGKGLYRVNSVVDCLNLTSICTGYSICGYDLKKIHGEIEMGIGVEGEPYRGIGRGVLNIAQLPVFRDRKGAFGTPTSDSERTLIDGATTEVLFVLPDFVQQKELEEALELLSRMLTQFVSNANPVRSIVE